MNEFIQHNPPHPGHILLKSYLEPLSLSITEVAEKLLVSRPNLSRIIKGKARISPLLALKLSKAFNTSPYLWLNMQNSYDLWYARNTSKDVNKIKPLV